MTPTPSPSPELPTRSTQLGHLVLLSLLSAALLTNACARKEAPRAAPDLELSLWLPEGAALTRDEPTTQGRALTWGIGRDVIALRQSDSIAPQAAKKRFGDRNMLMESLFSTHPTPYPGSLTNGSPCDTKYAPKRHDRDDARGQLVAYETTANDRFVMGGCTGETTSMKAVYALLYCPQSQIFYELHYFTPSAHPSTTAGTFINALSCRGAASGTTKTR